MKLVISPWNYNMCSNLLLPFCAAGWWIGGHLVVSAASAHRSQAYLWMKMYPDWRCDFVAHRQAKPELVQMALPSLTSFSQNSEEVMPDELELSLLEAVGQIAAVDAEGLVSENFPWGNLWIEIRI